MYKGREDITYRDEERREAHKEGKSALINWRFADKIFRNSQRMSSNAASHEASGSDVQIQPDGTSHKRKTRDNVRKVQELFTPQGANQANEVCRSSCLGPKIDTNIWSHSIKRRPTRNSRYANVVPFRLKLTKDQSLTPQQQDLDGATVEREEPSCMGPSVGHMGTPARRAGMSAGHTGTPTRRAGMSASRSGTSVGRSGTSGRAGTSASRAGTPVQFGRDRPREQEAEQALNQEHEVCRFNVSPLPHENSQSSTLQQRQVQEAVNRDKDMDLRQKQQERDEGGADKGREASHPRQDQATFNGHKVSLVTLFSRAST